MVDRIYGVEMMFWRYVVFFYGDVSKASGGAEREFVGGFVDEGGGLIYGSVNSDL